jgi:hypothetical protein
MRLTKYLLLAALAPALAQAEEPDYKCTAIIVPGRAHVVDRISIYDGRGTIEFVTGSAKPAVAKVVAMGLHKKPTPTGGRTETTYILDFPGVTQRVVLVEHRLGNSASHEQQLADGSWGRIADYRCE